MDYPCLAAVTRRGPAWFHGRREQPGARQTPGTSAVERFQFVRVWFVPLDEDVGERPYYLDRDFAIAVFFCGGREPDIGM